MVGPGIARLVTKPPAGYERPITSVGNPLAMAHSDNVRRVEHDGREILIIGTAHISQASVDEVRSVIEEERPDTVCVELDEMRLKALTDEEAWKRLDVFQVIKQKKVLFLMASIVLANHQRRMGDKLGVKPGAELLAAVQKAEEVGSEVVLADRPVQATLKRTWANLSFWNKAKVVSMFLGAGSEDDEEEDVTKEKIEALKDQDHISDMMKKFAEEMPQIKQPLIDERDLYLISMIREAPGKKIVAVVGAGHVEGMLFHVDTEVDRDALNIIPPPGRLLQTLKWLIPTVVLSAFAWGYFKHSGEDFSEMLKAWIIPNVVFAGLSAVIAGAKPLTVLVAMVASPITSLNPTIGAGMVAGLVETYLRKPRVEDCESVHEDIGTLRGMYRNQVLRVLLVVLLTSLGSSIGAWIGGGWVVSLL